MPHLYIHAAWILCCCHSFSRAQTFLEGADCIGGQVREDKEYPFSGVTSSGTVWRKVPESDAQCEFEIVTEKRVY